MAVAADVPGRFDVVIGGEGFMCAVPETFEAIFGFTPTFVPRTNVEGDYGDNKQDYWLTATQRDWALGEQLRFFRQDDRSRRYWQGTNLDVSVPGQVALAPSFTGLTFAAAVRAAARNTNDQRIVAASATNLYRVGVDGTITDHGAHGLGAAPSKFGIVCDGSDNYLTTTAAGTVGVRKWDGAAFSTFSAIAADSLEFLNNTLYGYRSASGDLVRWNSAGALTSLFTWRGVDGAAHVSGSGGPAAMLEAFGGKLLILHPYHQKAAELWIYDGTSPQMLHVFPANFLASDIEVLYGVAYIAGSFQKAATTTSYYNRPALYVYRDGRLDLLWQADDYNTTASSDVVGGPHPALASFGGRMVFTDDTTSKFMAYNPISGGVSSIGSYTSGGTDARLAATGLLLVHTRSGTGGYYFPHTTGYATTGTLTSPLIDFDSSLEKNFAGVSVEFASASDGNGGTVDVAYRLNNLNGSYTTLATGITSGQELTFSNVRGRGISIRITLNKGTSTRGPVLQRTAVRASPITPARKKNIYLLNLSGKDGRNPVKLNDGTFHPKDGLEQATALRTLHSAGNPVTITDEFGSHQAVIDEGFKIDRIRAGEYIATVPTREV